MAADQRDLRPLNLSPQQQWGAPQSPQSPQKVKFLCSFGGKILPRPSDGALRYVGGHTRIISVPKDLPFYDLMAKMSEVIGGGPVILKYQLPNEDLDALISVSCSEDLENMIDEYDKLVESSPDGSVKLRAFLFSPSDCSSDLGVVDMSDTGQRYYEAVNGIGASVESGGSSSIGSLKRKDSGLSAGSWNSGVGIDAADGINDCMSSPQTLNYLDPNQVQFLNTQPVNSQASNLKQVENFRPVQPLSQLPPLPPAYQNNLNVEGYGLNSSNNQGQGVRFDDCSMCQKMLPHAHSDALVQNLGSGSSPGAASPAFYSQQSEPTPTNIADNVGELHPNYGFHQVQYEGERPFVQKMENLDHARAFIPLNSMAISPDMHTQPTYGLFTGNFRQEDPQMLLLQQQQQQQQQQQPQLRQPQWLQNLVPPHYPPQQELINTQFGHNVNSGRNADGLPEFTNEHARPIQGMMKGLRLSPTEAPGSNLQGSAAGIADNLPSPLIVDGTYTYMPQVGGNVMMPTLVPFPNVGVVPERNYARPLDQIPQASSDQTRMQNLHAADPSHAFPMTVNQGPFLHQLGLRMEPPIPSEGLLGMPSYTSGVDSTHIDRPINKIPIGERKDESAQLYSKDMLDQSPVLLSGNVAFGLSNAGSPTGLVEALQEPAAMDSLFCNQDPRKILGGAHPLPPRPKRVASRESITPRDTGVQIHSGNSTASDIIALLEEGGLHPSPDSLNKDSHLDHVQSNKGSGDEQIKQDLQAVAEGVASSVLNSSFPQAPVFFAHDTPEFEIDNKFSDDTAEQQGSQMPLERKIEDNKPKVGFPITDDIGRLQIIKNSDLEELRELGSGTFGTVYHGKWRGTDVAIKRINDRCFAGKPSEQERMRADFWNEACKLADLHHPNVVAFYGVVLDGPGGSVATVTEYMVNGSLRNALQRNDKALDRRRRLIIAMDVAFGMEYLHGKNIVHFDLKSDNLLVNLRDPQRPICKVGDLGLSKVKAQTLISGGVRGTLPWMAPELLNGSSSLVSEKVDVFSFGIVMWELLTGEEPYADLHYGAIIGGIVSNTLRPPVPESCDPEWRALMERCWSADPSERPSFTEIVERLRCMAASLPQKGQAQIQK